jgi:hypothetical protein
MYHYTAKCDVCGKQVDGDEWKDVADCRWDVYIDNHDYAEDEAKKLFSKNVKLSYDLCNICVVKVSGMLKNAIDVLKNSHEAV